MLRLDGQLLPVSLKYGSTVGQLSVIAPAGGGRWLGAQTLEAEALCMVVRSADWVPDAAETGLEIHYGKLQEGFWAS